jgi:hypothetical protein
MGLLAWALARMADLQAQQIINFNGVWQSHTPLKLMRRKAPHQLKGTKIWITFGYAQFLV